MKILGGFALAFACTYGMAQNQFPLLSSGDYTGGSGDFTNITTPQLKLQGVNAYIRIAHLSGNSTVSTVYNFEVNKNVYWGEDNDGGTYLFRGRDVNIGRNLWVDKGATISSDFPDNDPNYSWNSNLLVRNNNNTNSTFSRISFLSQSGGFGAISVQKTDTYTGDMYFQVRNGAGFYQTPMILKSNGNIGIGTASPSAKLDVNGGIKVENTNEIELGGGISKETNAGKIAYQKFSDALDIVGAGTTGSNRKIKFWAEGGASFTGNVGIGTLNPDALLAVAGQIHAQEVKVSVTVPGPDYVFEKDYKLTSLEEIKNYIDQNKHLPEVPSAKEMEKNGVQLGEMNMLLLKKIEELTLYVIGQQKEINELRRKIK
jgi:hypothetical protein